jgi:hypothetical protein
VEYLRRHAGLGQETGPAKQYRMQLHVATNARTPQTQGAKLYSQEYEPTRGNMLEFNNFRMVNVIELVSTSQKSQKTQRFQGFKFIVQLHW